MPPNPSRRRKRRIVERVPLPQIELPHGHLTWSPSHIRKVYHEMFPTVEWIPARHSVRRNIPSSDMMIDMIRGGHAVVYPSTIGGKRMVNVILTSRGKNTRVLNRFLMDPTPLSQYPKERKEAVLFSLVRDLVYAFDYQSPSLPHRTQPAPLNRRLVIDQLKADTSYETIDHPLVKRYGIEMMNWPVTAKKYYQFMVKRANLSRLAIQWLQNDSNWMRLVRMRDDMTLYEGL